MKGFLIVLAFMSLSLIKGHSERASATKTEGVFEAEWRGLELSNNGEKGVPFGTIIFRDGIIYTSSGTDSPRKMGTYSSDDSKNPKELDFRIGFGPSAEFYPAIYRTIGENIEIYHPLGKKRVRPKKFDKVQGVAVMILGPKLGEQGVPAKSGRTGG